MICIIEWFTTDGNAFALLVTAGVALFLICCMECFNIPSRDNYNNDELFRHHVL
jgi:hypothetical protein